MRLIDADELLTAFPVDDEPMLTKSCVRMTIQHMPTIKPERKKGKWLPDNNGFYETRFVCSVCKESEIVPTIGFSKYVPIWDYCPNCGAKMER